MASATTAVRLGARVAGGTASAARTAMVALSAGVFCSGTPYAASSNIDAEADSNLKSWLPPQRVPVVAANGLMSVPWYRFFQYVAEKRLGGASAPSLPDVSANVVAAKQEAVAANAATATVAAQVKTNAESLEVVRQVAVNNNLSGAAQIPSVDLTFDFGE
jgi:hypothetical protein